MVQIAVGVASVQVATMNSVRLTLVFYNASLGGQTISLGKYGAVGLAAGNREYVLLPGQAIGFVLEYDGIDIRNEWGAYSDIAGGILVVGETAVRER